MCCCCWLVVEPWYQRTLRRAQSALKRIPAVFQVRRSGEYHEFRNGTMSSGFAFNQQNGGFNHRPGRGENSCEGGRERKVGDNRRAKHLVIY